MNFQIILQDQDKDIQDQPRKVIQEQLDLQYLEGHLQLLIQDQQIILHPQDMDILDQPPAVIQVNLVLTLEAKQTILVPVKDPKSTIHT